jgi:hypothetical protein
MLFENVAAAQTALQDAWRWPHFSIGELSCHCRGRFCGGQYWHDPTFLDALEAVREQVGRPLIINSGHRCDQWNAAVGGAALSQHKRLAVDISLRGHDRRALLEAAKEKGFNGLGLARSFLHLDRRMRPAIWFYKGSKHLWQI